jgi:hypothetical protein
MATTTNFALRTFPEFKAAAKSLVGVSVSEWEIRDARRFFRPVNTDSINSAFNTLIAKGLQAMSKILDNQLATGQAALAIAQEIMRFVLDNPAAQRVYAANFQEESSARRLIEASDAGNREAAENDGGVFAAGKGLSDAEDCLWFWLEEQEDGLSGQTAAKMLAYMQERVWKLASAKGALQRALATI